MPRKGFGSFVDGSVVKSLHSSSVVSRQPAVSVQHAPRRLHTRSGSAQVDPVNWNVPPSISHCSVVTASKHSPFSRQQAPRLAQNRGSSSQVVPSPRNRSPRSSQSRCVTSGSHAPAPTSQHAPVGIEPSQVSNSHRSMFGCQISPPRFVQPISVSSLQLPSLKQHAAVSHGGLSGPHLTPSPWKSPLTQLFAQYTEVVLMHVPSLRQQPPKVLSSPHVSVTPGHDVASPRYTRSPSSMGVQRDRTTSSSQSSRSPGNPKQHAPVHWFPAGRVSQVVPSPLNPPLKAVQFDLLVVRHAKEVSGMQHAPAHMFGWQVVSSPRYVSPR